jgi:hypothetical protein
MKYVSKLMDARRADRGRKIFFTQLMVCSRNKENKKYKKNKKTTLQIYILVVLF